MIRADGVGSDHRDAGPWIPARTSSAIAHARRPRGASASGAAARGGAGIDAGRNACARRLGRLSAFAPFTSALPPRLSITLADANRKFMLSVVGHLPRRRGCIRRTGSAGVGQRSREETAGRTRLGGAARSVYGDLRAAGQLSRVAGAAGWLGSDWRRHRQGGLMATSGRCRRVSQVVPCALDGVAASGIVAAGERRQ